MHTEQVKQTPHQTKPAQPASTATRTESKTTKQSRPGPKAKPPKPASSKQQRTTKKTYRCITSGTTNEFASWSTANLLRASGERTAGMENHLSHGCKGVPQGCPASVLHVYDIETAGTENFSSQSAHHEFSHLCGWPAVACLMGSQFRSLKKFCSCCQPRLLQHITALSMCWGLLAVEPNLAICLAQLVLISKKVLTILQLCTSTRALAWPRDRICHSSQGSGEPYVSGSLLSLSIFLNMDLWVHARRSET